MSDVTGISDILPSKYNNVINDNSVTDKTKTYKKDPGFQLHTPEAELALRIAENLENGNNFPVYLRTVKLLGVMRAEENLRYVESEIEAKANTRYEIRNKGAFYLWSAQHRYPVVIKKPSEA